MLKYPSYVASILGLQRRFASEFFLVQRRRWSIITSSSADECASDSQKCHLRGIATKECCGLYHAIENSLKLRDSSSKGEALRPHLWRCASDSQGSSARCLEDGDVSIQTSRSNVRGACIRDTDPEYSVIVHGKALAKEIWEKQDVLSARIHD